MFFANSSVCASGIEIYTAKKVYDLESKQHIETRQEGVPAQLANFTPEPSVPTTPPPAPKPPEEDKVVYDLESSDYEITEVEPSQDIQPQAPQNPFDNQASIEDRLEAKRQRLIEESQRRIRELNECLGFVCIGGGGGGGGGDDRKSGEKRERKEKERDRW